MTKADGVFNTQRETAPELIEIFGTADTWSEGLGRIDRVGPCRRLVFFGSDGMSTRTRVITAKIILPAEVLFDIAEMLAGDLPQPHAFAARHCAVAN